MPRCASRALRAHIATAARIVISGWRHSTVFCNVQTAHYFLRIIFGATDRALCETLVRNGNHLSKVLGAKEVFRHAPKYASL
jgi:hypothetical protein